MNACGVVTALVELEEEEAVQVDQVDEALGVVTGTGVLIGADEELDQPFHPELVAADGGPVGVEMDEEEEELEEDDDEEVIEVEIIEELDELDDPQEEPALTENCVESGNEGLVHAMVCM